MSERASAQTDRQIDEQTDRQIEKDRHRPHTDTSRGHTNTDTDTDTDTTKDTDTDTRHTDTHLLLGEVCLEGIFKRNRLGVAETHALVSAIV